MENLGDLLAVCVVAAIHILVSHLRSAKDSSRNVLLSLASGVALAYVFTYILPKLAAKHEVLAGADDPGLLGFLEHHAYLVALAGFLAFYALDIVAKRVKSSHASGGVAGFGAHSVFELQVAVFAAYSILIGYLLVQVGEPLSLWLMVLALCTHFLAADAALRRQNPPEYDHVTRWVFVVCTLSGWVLAKFYDASDAVEAVWFAFLAGSITIIVIKDEVPTEQHARFWPFLAGVVGYTGLILAIECV